MSEVFYIGFFDGETLDTAGLSITDESHPADAQPADLATHEVMRTYLLEDGPVPGRGLTLYDANRCHVAMVTVQKVYGREDVLAAVYRFDKGRLEWYRVTYVTDANGKYLSTTIVAE